MYKVSDWPRFYGVGGNATGQRKSGKNIFEMSVELHEPLIEAITATADSGTVSSNRHSLGLDTFIRLFFCGGWISSSTAPAGSMFSFSNVARISASGICDM